MLADDWKDKFLGQLNDLPVAGFKRFTTSLLEAEGFQDVVADDRHSNNQVSGHAIYRASLFGFKVRFLSLRRRPVTKEHFLSLEGSIRSHRERGLLISTEIIGKQLRDYCQEESRSSIDLIDGPMLCEACRNRRIGLTVTTHTVDKVETDLRDFGPSVRSEVPEPKVNLNPRAKDLYCDAWQRMANMVYKDNCRDLCAEILENRILGNRTILGKREEDLSVSTQEQGCFYTLKVGEHPERYVWLVNHGLSNADKRAVLRKVADFAGITFGKGQQIDVGF